MVTDRLVEQMGGLAGAESAELLGDAIAEVRIKWRDVWVGTFITSGLFIIGKFANGFYLGTSDEGSAYGVAGAGLDGSGGGAFPAGYWDADARNKDLKL